LAEAIRLAEPAGKRIPIVAITANAMVGESQRCLAHGMDDYLSKPLRMTELALMLSKWIPMSTALLTLPLGDMDRQVTPDLAVAWAPETLEIMVGNNPTMHYSLLEKFLINSEQQVRAVILAVGAGDLGAAIDVVHALKSASRMVGALRLGELSESIETAGDIGDVAHCQMLCQSLDGTYSEAKASIIIHIRGLALRLHP
jgi:CheY-like chemotaxis protein